MSNNSLTKLFDELKLKYNIKYLLTNRLNQDVLENFFGVIRAKGGLHDHPNQLQFMYRMRSYILGRNEGSISENGNTLIDPTPDLDIVTSLSQIYFKPIDVPEPTQPEPDELEALQYDALEHLAGYICKRLKLPGLSLEIGAPDNSYTWTNQLSEGFLYKPTDGLMGNMEALEIIFNQLNGEKILFKEGFLKYMLEKSSHIECDSNVKLLFFRSRMYFRMKKLNKDLLEQSFKKRKAKKILT